MSAESKPPGDPAAGLTDADRASAAEMGREQIRGSTLLLVGRVLSLLFTVTTQVVLVRMLNVTEFGSFAYALAVVTACGQLLSLGQGKMLSRFLSMYDEHRDHGRLVGCLALATLTIVITGCVLVGCTTIFAGGLTGVAIDDPLAIQVLVILVFLAPMEALDQCLIAFFAVFADPRTIFFRRYLLTPVLRLTVVLLLIALGQSVLFLAAGYVAAQLIGLSICTVIAIRILRARGLSRHARPRAMKFPLREVFSFSVPSLSTELVLLSMSTGSVIILAAYWGAAEVAGYKAVFPAARLNQFIFSAFVTLFVPLATRLFTREDRDGLRTTYWQAALFLTVFTFPVFALTFAFAPTTTVTLFGEDYAGSSTVLALLAAGYYINVVLGFNTYMMSVLGRVRYLLGVNIGMAGLNIPLCLVLVPRYGATGVAVANCCTLTTQNILNQIVVTRELGTGIIDRRLLMPYGVVAAGVATLWTVDAVFAPGFVVAVLSSAAASMLILFLTRRRLELGQTFPVVTRVPLLRTIVR